MIHQPHPSAVIVRSSLERIDNARQDYALIDRADNLGLLEPDMLVMTSIGRYRRAVITPFYHGIEYEWGLPHRLERAKEYGRPLIEAALTGPKVGGPGVANVTLRLCMTPTLEVPYVIETAWEYPVPSIEATEEEKAPKPKTLDDLVREIKHAVLRGKPVRSRSGVVQVTERRKEGEQWKLSRKMDPTDAVGIIHGALASNQLRFTQLIEE